MLPIENEILEKEKLNLLCALHSYFYFNNLLTYKTNTTGLPVYRMTRVYKNKIYFYYMWDDNSLIYRLTTLLSKCDKLSLEDANTIFNNQEENFSTKYSMLWQLLVSMFGEYEVLTKNGVIKNTKDCAKFIYNVITIGSSQEACDYVSFYADCRDDWEFKQEFYKANNIPIDNKEE